MHFFKKILASLSLMALAVMLNGPLALAADTGTQGVDPESYRCNAPSETSASQKAVEEPILDGDLLFDAQTIKANPNHVSKYQKMYDDKFAAEVNATKKDNKCGEKNAFTGYLEKADCTANGQAIVEISESFANAATYGSGNEVVDVYKGLCCMFINKTTKECEDTRTVYFKDMQSCMNDKADYCQARQWLISTSGAGLIKLYIKQIYAWGAGTAGFIAVIVIIVSGIQIQVSGVSGDISASKQRITQSLAGLALIFLSGVLLLAINPDFFGS